MWNQDFNISSDRDIESGWMQFPQHILALLNYSTVYLRNSNYTIFEGLMLIKNSSKVVAVQLSLVADRHAAVGDDALVTLT